VKKVEEGGRRNVMNHSTRSFVEGFGLISGSLIKPIKVREARYCLLNGR
jgi:hypothetical protein